MRYELGVLDKYPIAVARTVIANNPFIQAVMKHDINPEKLEHSVHEAFKLFPLMRTQIVYSSGFFLETNEREFHLIHAPEESRPLAFGKNTNGFPLQLCWDKNTVSFEWCHALTDGRGALAFFCTVLSLYCGEPMPPVPEEFPLETGSEHFYDKSERGFAFKKQPDGFAASAVPYFKRGYKTDCHILKVSTESVLRAAKKNDASPATIIPPLFSRALRMHMKQGVKNRNVSCSVVIDCRVPMHFSTMHNCILTKNITYTDRFDSMDFSLVSTIYRSILDLAVVPENIVRACTEQTDMIGPMVNLKPRFLLKAFAKIIAKLMKHSESNFTFTYLGKLHLSEKVLAEIDDFNMRSYPDFGESNIAAVDFNGTFIMNICENYKNKGIVSSFIELCHTYGIPVQETTCKIYEQAGYRE